MLSILVLATFRSEQGSLVLSVEVSKMQKIVVVARIFESTAETCSRVHAVASFDLDNPKIFNQIKADYITVQEAIKANGFDSLTGKMGILIQPRTKGPGHGSISRAFYARKCLVAHILGLNELIL
jgi:DNA mismatch repair protein MutH